MIPFEMHLGSVCRNKQMEVPLFAHHQLFFSQQRSAEETLYMRDTWADEPERDQNLLCVFAGPRRHH